MIPDRLLSANLLMRPFAIGDGSAVYEYWQSDPGWEQYNASVPSGFSKMNADNFVTEMCGRDRSEQPNWALIHDNIVVGIVSLTFEQDHRIVVIGYGIHADLRGRGLCAEAATTVLSYAFSSYPKLRMVRAHTDMANSASIRVLMKLGFSAQSFPSDGRNGEGQSQGEAVFCLKRDEWRAQNDT